MVEMIQERQRGDKVQRHDLLSNLLAANDHTLDVTTLSEDELIGLWATNVSLLLYKIILQATFTSSSLLVMRFEFESCPEQSGLISSIHPDDCTYLVLYICYACIISRGARKTLWAHQICHSWWSKTGESQSTNRAGGHQCWHEKRHMNKCPCWHTLWPSFTKRSDCFRRSVYLSFRSVLYMCNMASGHCYPKNSYRGHEPRH